VFLYKDCAKVLFIFIHCHCKIKNALYLILIHASEMATAL